MVSETSCTPNGDDAIAYGVVDEIARRVWANRGPEGALSYLHTLDH